MILVDRAGISVAMNELGVNTIRSSSSKKKRTKVRLDPSPIVVAVVVLAAVKHEVAVLKRTRRKEKQGLG